MSEFTASPERLIIGALLGFAVLLFLIIKVKIQPFIAIMSSALIIALVAGMPFSMITDTLAEGVGTTLPDHCDTDRTWFHVRSDSAGVRWCGSYCRYAVKGIW